MVTDSGAIVVLRSLQIVLCLVRQRLLGYLDLDGGRQRWRAIGGGPCSAVTRKWILVLPGITVRYIERYGREIRANME